MVNIGYLGEIGLKITLSDRLTLNDVKVDVKGCPLDSDKDGILDYLDKFENTPLGVTVNKDIQIVRV